MTLNLSVPLARRMIEQLKKGTTPLEGVRALNVGRERYFEEADRALEDISAEGGASVRFLNGEYGHGKTHFIGMINASALDRGWVTSYVKLSTADGVRLDKFEQLYAAILRNCLCRRLIDAHQQLYDPGEANGWAWILDDWVQRHLQAEAGSGVDRNSQGARERTASALEVLLRKANVSGDFAAAVRAYVSASFARADPAERMRKEAVLRWFACEKTPELKPYGVLSSITSKNARQVLRNLICLLREFGYGGMAFFVDEIENVLTKHYTKPQRQVAYQNLRDLLDNIDGGVSGVGLNRSVCYLAATPVMFSGERGFREYPALYDRIDEVRLPIAALRGLPDYRAIVINLAACPLESEHRRKLAERIRDIHALAFRWDPAQIVTDAWLDMLLVEYEKHMAEQGGLRPLCRAVAKALELAEQHRHTLAPQDAASLVSAAFREEGR